MYKIVSAQRMESSLRLQRAVAGLAFAVAERMGLPEHEVETTHAAARLHDIGELGLPARIFLKRSKLTRSEYRHVQEHCRIGYEILRGLDCPWSVRDVVLSHHERMDGSGYPRGLKAEEIPRPARILAVADVVGAVCTDRPYRKARGIDFALAELRRGRATLYDPDAVDACIGLFEEDGFPWPPPNPAPSSHFEAWVRRL